MLSKTLEAKKELAEKKAREKQEKWQLLKDEGLRKAAIEERRVFADETKAMAKLLAEENWIMTLNRDYMDDITKEWHDMARRDILKRRMLAAAGGCFGAVLFSHQELEPVLLMHSVRPVMLSVSELEQVPVMDSGAAMTLMGWCGVKIMTTGEK